MLTFSGHVNIGASQSSTFTVKLHVVVFVGVALSVDVTVTVLDPISKIYPSIKAVITDDPSGFVTIYESVVAPQSVVNGFTEASLVQLHVPASLQTLILGGQTSSGFCVSTTVTSVVHTEALPQLSTAVNVTVVIPIGNWTLGPGVV